MHLIAEAPLRHFWSRHPDAEAPLRAWIKLVKHADWHQFSDVRATFATADQVGKFTVFNIGGNKFRLIAVIHYNRSKLYVRHILTHADYDQGAWKQG